MNNISANKKKYKISNSLLNENKVEKEKCILNTTIDFGGLTNKKYKITTTDLYDNKFNIAKLEFEK